jgi:hypothetical protein
MSTPIRLVPTVSAAAKDNFRLTPVEMRMIQSFRALSDAAQDFVAEAIDHHAKAPELMRDGKPAFRVITAGETGYTLTVCQQSARLSRRGEKRETFARLSGALFDEGCGKVRQCYQTISTT